MAARTTRQIRTACDRCYKLKEKCLRASPSTICARCERLCLACITVRPVRPAGRRPKGQEQSSQSVSRTTTSRKGSSSRSAPITLEEQPLADITAWIQDIPDLELEEKKLLQVLLGRPENLDFYVVVPSLQSAQQRSLTAPLPAALPILKDAYLACAGALKLLQSGVATDQERDVSLRHASSAMVILRALPIKSPQDAAICLALGTALALFVYSAIGVGTPDICHYCLSVTTPFVGTSCPDPDAESWQIYLVLLETMDCLVHRKRPTLRIEAKTLENVDRHIGLCVPILQYYYDLCVISNSMSSTNDTLYLTYLAKQLDNVETAVETWQPSQSDHLIDQFESIEVVNLLAQAKVYRLAGLLVSHRLRYPFGEQDSKADLLSKEIMMELELAERITKRLTRCVTIPFIAAAVEIRDLVGRTNAFRNVDKYVDQFTPVVQKAAKKFLCTIWQERDTEVSFCWYDSISKPCVVMQAVDSCGFG